MIYCPNCGKKNKNYFKFCYHCGASLKANNKIKREPKPKESNNTFQVNEYITLKLEKGKTVIYLKDEKFRLCKYLLLDIPLDKIEDFEVIDSIDEASEILDHSMENNPLIKIPPEIEFWGHSSNIQAWAENNYDTRLLHSNLAFPLLKELTDLGDPAAKRVFKEEIAKRVEAGHKNTIDYLLNQNYLSYLQSEELEILLGHLKKNISEELRAKYKHLVVPEELNVLLDIIDLNFLNSKTLKLKRFTLITPEAKDTQIGFFIKNGKITKINLFKSNIVQLPESLGDLTHLESLTLIGNGLKELPDGLCKLTNLKTLILSGNHIEILPRDIGNLRSLKILKIDNNQLRSLPSSINELNNLEILSLWNNRLKKLPPNWGNLKALKILGLSYNKLTHIPISIFDLPYLQNLDLSNNLIEFIPPEVGNLQTLQVLWLNNNFLRTIPENLLKLQSLRQIYYFGNQFSLRPNNKIKDLLNRLESRQVNLR